MKIRKIDDVNFNINLPVNGDGMKMKWRRGQLYISLSSLLISDDKQWYEMPVAELSDIELVDDAPPKVRFNFKNYQVTLTSKNMHQLRALQHFLMPFIT